MLLHVPLVILPEYAEDLALEGVFHDSCEIRHLEFALDGSEHLLYLIGCITLSSMVALVLSRAFWST